MDNTCLCAAAFISGGEEFPHLKGVVRFYRSYFGVIVEARIEGLPENASGFYSIHIHEGTSCLGADFPCSGMHFNPRGTLHPNHSGDLPPLLGNQGRAYMKVLTDRFEIKDIIGRTVIIHSDPDDFRTQPSGNAGKKIGCGVILYC